MMAFAGRRGFRPGLFLIVASVFFTGALSGARHAAAAEAVSGGAVLVTLDRAKIVKLPEKTATLVIGNPLIADAAVQPGGIAVITAKSHGATNLVALDRSGATLFESTLQVVSPTDNVVVMYRGVDRETYSCAPDCSRRTTIGDTPAYFTANLNQIGTFGALAQGAAGQGGPR